MKRWQCMICGWIYSEADGCPEEGIEPGTAWADVSDDWFCPDCGAEKPQFDMMELME